MLKRGPLYILTIPHTLSNPVSGYTNPDFQSVMPPANGIINLNTIPANTLEVGSTFIIKFSGNITLPLASDRLGIALYNGTTAMSFTNFWAWTAYVGTAVLTGEIRITVQSIGISGVLASQSFLFSLRNAPTSQSSPPATATINTTINNTLTARVYLGTANDIGTCIYIPSSVIFEQLY